RPSMTGKGAALQGGFAACGLLLAYTTWQREPERAPGEVIVMEATRNEVRRVRFEEGNRFVELEHNPSGEPAVLLRTSASTDGKTPARTLRGNEQAQKTLESFAPLRATRALGALDAAKRKELGLDTTKKRLTIEAREKRAFAVATPGYGSPYLKDERDGRVYV